MSRGHSVRWDNQLLHHPIHLLSIIENGVSLGTCEVSILKWLKENRVQVTPSITIRSSISNLKWRRVGGDLHYYFGNKGVWVECYCVIFFVFIGGISCQFACCHNAVFLCTAIMLNISLTCLSEVEGGYMTRNGSPSPWYTNRKVPRIWNAFRWISAARCNPDPLTILEATWNIPRHSKNAWRLTCNNTGKSSSSSPSVKFLGVYTYLLNNPDSRNAEAIPSAIVRNW